MKVHAYKVEVAPSSEPLDAVLEQIEAENSPRRRIRLINHVELRAEAIVSDNGLWLLDFVRIRTTHGPGKVGRDSEVEGFEFDEEEGFGEETAALYDPGTGYLLVQYNHHGVRFGVMADYFSAFNEAVVNLYTLKPKFDEDVERRLIGQGITKKLAFTIDVGRMSAQDIQRGAPLSKALDYGVESGADKIKVEISVRGDKSRSLSERVQDALGALRSMAGHNEDAVTKLEVSGKESADSITEVLDLLGHRLSIEFNDLTPGADLRYSRDDRWNALKRARNGWARILV
ncbi:hypothetical protein AYI84_04670 [Shewanella algae]|uniref:DUF6731 family protein n=1 Tax=Shewanella algae TaxID=38313 RepID=UPI00118448CF|nr:DUF6731 family protein [Shewanella algae]MBO2568626.1 hypothetical protein [Shewanella algae]TVL05288.1 hypothetical protein AYI84_04670 [Shewanella algae]